MSSIRSHVSIEPICLGHDRRNGNGEPRADTVTPRLATLAQRAVLFDDVTTVCVSVSANYTITEDDHTVLASAAGGNVVVTLPNPAAVSGREYRVKRTDSSANTLTVARNGSESIDGTAANITVGALGTATLKSDGVNWWLMSVSTGAAGTGEIERGTPLPVANTRQKKFFILTRAGDGDWLYVSTFDDSGTGDWHWFPLGGWGTFPAAV